MIIEGFKEVYIQISNACHCDLIIDYFFQNFAWFSWKYVLQTRFVLQQCCTAAHRMSLGQCPTYGPIIAAIADTHTHNPIRAVYSQLPRVGHNYKLVTHGHTIIISEQFWKTAFLLELILSKFIVVLFI